jgi:hypothetical protein
VAGAALNQCDKFNTNSAEIPARARRCKNVSTLRILAPLDRAALLSPQSNGAADEIGGS